MDKTIIIVDTVWTGHAPMCHKFYVKALVDLGCHVVSLSPAPDEIAKWVEISMPGIANNLSTEDFDLPWANRVLMRQAHENRKLSSMGFIINWGKSIKIPFSGWFENVFYTYQTWRTLQKKIKKYRRSTGISPDLVFIPWMDSNFMVTGVTGNLINNIFHYHWSGLYNAPTDFRINDNIKKKNIIETFLPAYDIFKSKNLVALSTLDEGTIDRLKKYFKKPVVFFPNNTDESLPQTHSPLASEILKRAKGRKIINLMGVLARRKGIEVLLKSAEILNKSNEGYYFVFAGPLFIGKETEYISKSIQRSTENCYFYTEWIEKDERFNELIKISDIIFAAYQGFYHSSGILTKAAVFRKPVIVSEGYCMGERVEKYRLGLTIPEGNVDRCVEAIRCLSKGKDYDGRHLKPDYESFCNIHSQNALVIAFEKVLQYV